MDTTPISQILQMDHIPGTTEDLSAMLMKVEKRLNDLHGRFGTETFMDRAYTGAAIKEAEQLISKIQSQLDSGNAQEDYSQLDKQNDLEARRDEADSIRDERESHAFDLPPSNIRGE
jgi:hypothetical protein